MRNLTHSSGSAERDPAWSPDGKYISYFSDKTGEYRLVLEEQDGLTPPREITLQKPTHYYTPSWSPDSKKLLYHGHEPQRVGARRRDRPGEDRRHDQWMVPERTLNPVVEPGFEVGRVLEPAAGRSITRSS